MLAKKQLSLQPNQLAMQGPHYHHHAHAQDNLLSS